MSLSELKSHNESQKRYYQTHRETIREQVRRRLKNNMAKHAKENKEWARKNPNKIKKWNKRYRDNNPETIKKFHDIHNKNRIKFKGKPIVLGFNPRKGTCSKCGQSVGKGEIKQTVLHHIKYDSNNPLAHTVELCRVCHCTTHEFGKSNRKLVVDLE